MPYGGLLEFITLQVHETNQRWIYLVIIYAFKLYYGNPRYAFQTL